MTSDQALRHSTEHGSFRIERELAAAPPRAFAAWADQSAKARWFGPPEKPEYTLDFRVGGSEHLAIDSPNGRYSFDAIYYDIVPDSRIIYSYEMYLDNQRISVSIACVEFEATSSGTRMTLN